MTTTHPTIQQLLREWRDRTSYSYQHMATAAGDVITRSNLHELTTNGPKSWPDAKTVTALADALTVSEQTVVLAYAAALGLPIRSERSLLATMLPANADYLTMAERTHIIGIVHALTAGRTAPPGNDG